ncbi:MAG: DNA repair and recombination protein RadA, partial [Candidatus Odinarchaeota archaeon]
ENLEEEEEEPAAPSELTQLTGVGPSIAKRLAESGYNSVEAVAVTTADELAAAVDVGKSTAQKIIESARELLKIGFETADNVYEKRKNIGRITTGSKNLDSLIGGGVETQSITEVFGPFRSGKTQLAHQLSVFVQLPVDKGGLNGKALYIDCEGTFRPERIVQMAAAVDLDPKIALKNIWCARAYNSDHQMLLCQQASELIKKENLKLIVIDSIMSHFRAEYIGREMLARRQQKLNKHLHMLERTADIENVAILITNQVMAKPDTFFGDPTEPVGGHVLAHVPQTRLYLRRSKGNRRICRLVDSPWMPEGEAVFIITAEGIRDP